MSKKSSAVPSRECFQGVDIAGGVTYFLWDRAYNGLCETVLCEGGEEEKSVRQLDEFPVFITSETAVGIIRKIRAKSSRFYDSIVRARNPYSVGAGSEYKNGDLQLRYRGGMTTINSSDVTSGTEILPPKAICSETYLVIDSVPDKQTADNLLSYIKTKFVRYLIWQATPTQNISKGCFMFVPDFNLSEEPTDERLYAYFGLTEHEIEDIEKKIKPHGQVEGE